MQPNTPPTGPFTILTKEQITDAINTYTSILNSSPDLISKFQQGACYHYTVQQYSHPSTHIHAYPAILDGILNFFMIPSHYDSVDYEDTFNEYVQACPVFWTEAGGILPPGQQIDELTALQRIESWNDNYEGWIAARVAAADPGMFQAFQIGTDDFTEPVVYAHLALKKVTTPVKGYQPDLIIINGNAKSQTFTFDDFVKPVPPFGASAAASSFYLLSL